jgi:hypothetical protein
MSEILGIIVSQFSTYAIYFYLHLRGNIAPSLNVYYELEVKLQLMIYVLLPILNHPSSDLYIKYIGCPCGNNLSQIVSCSNFILLMNWFCRFFKTNKAYRKVWYSYTISVTRIFVIISSCFVSCLF